MADGKIRCSLSDVTIETARKTVLLGGAVYLCFLGSCIRVSVFGICVDRMHGVNIFIHVG